MDFKLSREQAMIQRAAREFSRKAVEPISAQLPFTPAVWVHEKKIGYKMNMVKNIGRFSRQTMVTFI